MSSTITSALLDSPDEALSDVAERSVLLKEILTGVGIPEKDRVTSGLSVREEREWTKEKYVHRGYRATTSVVVTVTDASIIGASDAARRRGGRCRHLRPTWRVALDNPAHTQARKDAIADARRRAQAYAEALGVRLGAVVEVSEPGLRERRSNAVYERAVLGDDSMSAAVEVEAGEMDISCAIDVVYRIEQ